MPDFNSIFGLAEQSSWADQVFRWVADRERREAEVERNRVENEAATMRIIETRSSPAPKPFFLPPPPPPPPRPSPSPPQPTPRAVIQKAGLNPNASTFNFPASAAPSVPVFIIQQQYPPSTIQSGPQWHLDYTERSFMRGPAARVDTIIERLRVLPADKFRPDGTVLVEIQFAIARIGYAHLARSERTGRAVLRNNSSLRTEGVAWGVPRTVIDWLCEERGLGGPEVVVPAEEARLFWR